MQLPKHTTINVFWLQEQHCLFAIARAKIINTKRCSYALHLSARPGLGNCMPQRLAGRAINGWLQVGKHDCAQLQVKL